jgi:hypothetical protein
MSIVIVLLSNGASNLFLGGDDGHYPSDETSSLEKRFQGIPSMSVERILPFHAFDVKNAVMTNFFLHFFSFSRNCKGIIVSLAIYSFIILN